MALVDEATAETGGIWSAALLIVADSLMDVGERLHAHLSRKRLAHAHGAHRVTDSACHRDGALCERVVWLDR